GRPADRGGGVVPEGEDVAARVVRRGARRAGAGPGQGAARPGAGVRTRQSAWDAPRLARPEGTAPLPRRGVPVSPADVPARYAGPLAHAGRGEGPRGQRERPRLDGLRGPPDARRCPWGRPRGADAAVPARGQRDVVGPGLRLPRRRRRPARG